MSATTRTIQATPDAGRLFAIIASIMVATALLVALAYGQLAANGPQAAPAAGVAPAAYDHDSSGSGSWGPVVTDASRHTRFGR